MKEIENNYEEVKAKVDEQWPLIKEKYSFEAKSAGTGGDCGETFAKVISLSAEKEWEREWKSKEIL